MQGSVYALGPETFFKLAFGLIFGVLVAASADVARHLRQRPGGRVNQSGHELPALRILRPALGIVLYLALADWLLPGRRLAWAEAALGTPLRLAGVALGIMSTGLVWWAFRSLGRNYRGGVGLWADHELVTHGAYRWIQHPVYSGFIVLMVGVFLVSADWMVGLSGLSLTLIIPWLRLPVEERQLRERFGQAHGTYQDVTPRFLPGLF